MSHIRPDDRVITVSQFVKDELCQRIGINPANVSVTHLAADRTIFHPCTDPQDLLRVRQRYGIPDGPYLLSLGSLTPHKNIGHLIRCYGRLVQQERITDLTLVLAGVRGWDPQGLDASMTATHSGVGRIVQTGFVADEDQAALYSGASAFVFPSLCEGFGLPVLEAMQCGVAVISARSTSLPEVVGDAAIQVPPHDADALCEAMLELYRSESRRLELISQGQARSNLFSWTRCAEETLEVYRSARASR